MLELDPEHIQTKSRLIFFMNPDKFLFYIITENQSRRILIVISQRGRRVNGKRAVLHPEQPTKAQTVSKFKWDGSENP